MPDNATRRLIWIPVIHTQADLGSMSEAVRRLYIRKIGRRKWQEHLQAVAQMWQTIREEIERLDLDYGKVRLYQDGLPNCGHEEEIVRHVAQAGSPNHQILLDLMAKGARLMGTEAPELLLEEYNLARQALWASGADRTGQLAQRQRELSEQMLDRRDRSIAERIDQTLQPGETGLLFLGMLHALDGHLPADIQVLRLEHVPAPTRPRETEQK